MTPKIRAFLLGVANLGVLMILVYFLAFFMLTTKTDKIDENNTFDGLWRSVSVFDAEYDSLAQFPADWGAWDDSYFYMGDLNQEYVDSSFTVEAFELIDVTDVIYLNTEGEAVLSVSYDFEEGEELPLADDLQEELVNGKLAKLDVNKESGGVLFLPERTVLLSAHPILTSKGTGPSRGLLIMVRELDEARMETLSEQLNHEMEIVELSNDTLPEEVDYKLNTQQSNYVVVEKDADYYVGYHPITDLYEEKTGLIKITLKRDVKNAMSQNINYFLSFLLLVNVLSFLSSYYVLTAILFQKKRNN